MLQKKRFLTVINRWWIEMVSKEKKNVAKVKMKKVTKQKEGSLEGGREELDGCCMQTKIDSVELPSENKSCPIHSYSKIILW